VRLSLSRSRRLLVAAALPVAVAVAAGCSGSSAALKSSHPSPTPVPSKPPAPYRNPLTGLVGKPGHRLLVVKIDNTRPSHPQIGLEDADIGYIEQVEGGLTRMAVVFASRYPKVVGPIRSARETDIDLFAQYGKVAFAYSGAQPTVTRELNASPLRLEVDGSAGGGWFRGEGRSAPYNLFANAADLVKAQRHSPKVHDVGFRFGTAPTWMKKTTGFDGYFPMAHVSWRYNAAHHVFQLSMDGSPSTTIGHGPISAANVIVQYVKVVNSRLHDVNHNPTPYTTTTGSGKAMFFRDGKFVWGTWSRKNKQSGTTWHVGKDNVTYHFRPGKTWILLMPDTRRVTVHKG
jgi:DUF3048 family protein